MKTDCVLPRAAAALTLLCLLAASHCTSGAAIEGVEFKKSVTVDGRRLELVGTGLQRYMVFYKVCVAAFYLPSGTDPEKALNDVAKRLEIEYFHEIRDDQFAEMTTRGVQRNTTARRFDAVRSQLDQLNQAYETVKPGDRYALTYIPGKGTTLALNGTDKATFEGADFAQALFSVWLGKRPITDGLKDGLLGTD